MWPTHYIPKQERVEGTPPPRYYLTTPPYPCLVVEKIRSEQAEFVGGSQGLGSEDEISSAVSFVSGAMEEFVYSELEPLRDDLESAISFVSGTLVIALKQIEVGPDELESAVSFVSGELRNVLIVYDNWPLGADTEDLLSSVSFVSGVLS